jgi:hypothetical protein
MNFAVSFGFILFGSQTYIRLCTYKSFDVSLTNTDIGEKLSPDISEEILIKSVQMTDFINGVTSCALQGARIVKVFNITFEYHVFFIMAPQPFVGPWPLFQFLDPIHSQ